jgi:nicotinamidase-related amidase
MSNPSSLPLPDFYDPSRVGSVWRVPYAERAAAGADWARRHALAPVESDTRRISLLLVDVQNTFCLPDFELFVAGRSGTGAVDDNRRLCEFIYRNLGVITHITATMDTHQMMQVFHAVFLVDADGRHPAPYSLIEAADVETGKWRFNPALAGRFRITPEYGQEMMIHYTRELAQRGKYALTIWPYHAMLGGIGHALVSSVEEAIFFHSAARLAQPQFEIKGNQPFTEHYSVLGPEVTRGPKGETLGTHNPKFVENLKEIDALVIAGQAKSHCVAWTISDLLYDIRKADASLAEKVYLLEDCSSPVVVPGADFTEAGDRAYAGFAEAGMHLVRSTEPFLETIA